jgi:hypothetical protein
MVFSYHIAHIWPTPSPSRREGSKTKVHRAMCTYVTYVSYVVNKTDEVKNNRFAY